RGHFPRKPGIVSAPCRFSITTSAEEFSKCASQLLLLPAPLRWPPRRWVQAPLPLRRISACQGGPATLSKPPSVAAAGFIPIAGAVAFRTATTASGVGRTATTAAATSGHGATGTTTGTERNLVV